MLSFVYQTANVNCHRKRGRRRGGCLSVKEINVLSTYEHYSASNFGSENDFMLRLTFRNMVVSSWGSNNFHPWLTQNQNRNFKCSCRTKYSGITTVCNRRKLADRCIWLQSNCSSIHTIDQSSSNDQATLLLHKL